MTLPQSYATMVVGPAFGPAFLILQRRTILMIGLAFHNQDPEPCDRRWTVSGWAVTSRMAGLMRLLDDSFSLPGVQPVCLYA